MLALKLLVTGIVQGVGFRPFVHRIAMKTGVAGYVRNVGGSEVEILVEGDLESVKRFLRALLLEKPPTALIEELEVSPEKPRGLKGFSILKSGTLRQKLSMIPPDFAICGDCLREVLDPRDRRYRYAFNSCAWCGPRFSMMYGVPYDRENTAMRKYHLCPECRREYEDPSNLRRYHAQGISCPKDGPRLWLAARDGEPVETRDPIREAAKLVDEGYIVAVKGLGGYHIAALASDDDVVLKLRRRKGRPRKPFAVMALDVEVASKLVYLTPEAVELLRSPQRPIVLLPKRPDTPVSNYVSPGLAFEGVFTPYTALHYLLLMETRDKFLIMTSGNPTGLPMCIDEECAFTKLSSVADYFLVHDREIVNRVDDSVVRFTDGEPVLIRRARGYAPAWIRLPERLERPVVAMGADLQSAGAVAFEDKVVLTQFIGDVDEVETLEDLDKYLKFFIRCYGLDLSKGVVVVDKHPAYQSRALGLRYAEDYGAELVEVQHHVAHVAATMADRGVGGAVVGVAMDGTGYGDDGAVWGGELILVDVERRGYSRLGHLEYQPLDSERSVYYPARFFVAVLARKLEWEELEALARRWGLDKAVPGGLRELELVYKRVRVGAYTPTSSTGRFLDGISAFLGLATYRSYEGEPAIVLEAAALSPDARYLGEDVLAPRPVVRGGRVVVETSHVYESLPEIAEKARPQDIAYTALYNLGRAVGEAVALAAKGRRLEPAVPLGGGAVVNTLIVKGIRDSLRSEDLQALLPRRVPPNDGGIALGQVASLVYLGLD